MASAGRLAIRKPVGLLLAAALTGCASTVDLPAGGASAETITVAPSRFPLVHVTSERYQSFQVGMSHLTGGETWRSYDAQAQQSQPESFEAVREARAPTDLANPQLHTLAQALGPFYVRYGGTTANSVYFHDSDLPPPAAAPDGFKTLLTRERWRDAIEFADAVDARILTGFTVSDGVRNLAGEWTPIHARPWLEFTQAAGGEIVAAELYNEPNAREPGRTEEPESAADFARDFRRLQETVEDVAPHLLLAGPGTAHLGVPVPVASLEGVTPEAYAQALPAPAFDIVSYHFYGALAERCAPTDSPVGISADKALDEEWLARPDVTFQRIRELRDALYPGAPIWLTETGAAACGGPRWQPTFLDTFRYLDTLARLAKQGLDVIVTHALISGSNGIVDEQTFEPNADYWAALLWRRTMGSRVLDVGQQHDGLHLYAHCRPDGLPGVTVLAINLGNMARSVEIPVEAEIFSLTSTELESRVVQVNGQPLALSSDGTLPSIAPRHLDPGTALLEPHSSNFLVMPGAQNRACDTPSA